MVNVKNIPITAYTKESFEKVSTLYQSLPDDLRQVIDKGVYEGDYGGAWVGFYIVSTKGKDSSLIFPEKTHKFVGIKPGCGSSENGFTIEFKIDSLRVKYYIQFLCSITIA